MYYDINEVNPYIRIARESIISAGAEIKRRIIFDYELIYIDDGSFTLVYDDKEYACKKGQFVFLHPGIPHSFKNINQNLSQPHIHFDVKYSVNSTKTPISFKDFSELSDEEKKLVQKDVFGEYPTSPFIKFADSQKAIKLFYEIVLEPHQRSLVQKSKLIQIIDMLIADNYPECFSFYQKKLSIANQIKDYIDSNYGVTVGLPELEKQFSYSRFYLEQQFKAEFGVGIISYRNSKRMERAKQVLKRESVQTTAEKLGFSSIYVFSRAFKNYYNISPLQYKKSKEPKN